MRGPWWRYLSYALFIAQMELWRRFERPPEAPDPRSEWWSSALAALRLACMLLLRRYRDRRWATWTLTGLQFAAGGIEWAVIRRRMKQRARDRAPAGEVRSPAR